MLSLQHSLFLVLGIASSCNGEELQPAATSLSVLSTSFCYYCLPAEARGHQTSPQLAPAYIELAGPASPHLPIDFTACSTTTSLPDDDGTLLLLSILDQTGENQLLSLSMYSRGFEDRQSTFYVAFNDFSHLSLKSLPMFFPHQWVRSCLAINGHTGLLQWVVDGHLLVDHLQFTSWREGLAEKLPKNLTGRLLLGIEGSHSQWLSVKQRMTHLNIFSSPLSIESMKSITRGGGQDCGRPGDFLAWQDMEWSLHGGSLLETLDPEEPCEEEPMFNLYNAYFLSMKDCMQHCEKLGTRAPPVVTQKEWDQIQGFMDKELYQKGHGNKVYGIWLPITDASEEGIWIDYYTGEVVQHKGAFTGNGPNGGLEENCALQVTDQFWHDWTCNDPWPPVRAWRGCLCSRQPRPYLILRGLCPHSSIDTLFLPRNSRKDVTKLTFVSNRDSKIEYDSTSKQWTLSMQDSELNTFGSSEASLDSFVLGKHTWRIQNDSYECSSGRPYVTELKLTGCGEGEFTCNDGQCVTMEQRCNQIPNCRDKSDEQQCELVKFEDGYNKKVPPITFVSSSDDSIVPVSVNVSIDLLKIVRMEEVEHLIELQFEIILEWRDLRVTFHNLKHDSSLNALPDEKVQQLWLPLVIFANTDQKETTRLGENWEWSTSLVVKREGRFTRSKMEQLHEIELFRGDESTLRMQQVLEHQTLKIFSARFTVTGSNANTSSTATHLTRRLPSYPPL